MTTTMNTLVKGIEVDHINEVIRMTKSFSKLAQNPKTPEFALFIETKRACTGYTVEVKTIETNENKESYKDLSIEKMLAYVHIFENGKLTDFEKAVEVYVEANGKVQKGKYATIKKVFLNRFKETYIEKIADINNVVRIDEKAKELKEKSKGLIGHMLTKAVEENPSDNKIKDFPTDQKKAVNE